VFLKEQGKSIPAIAREVKCGESSVTDVFKRWQETGTVDEREGRGRKRKLSAADEKKVMRKARRRKSARKIASELEGEGKSINEITVRRILKKQKFFFLPPLKVKKLSKIHKKRRVAYAKEMMNTEWESVLFTDEKSFWLGNPSDPCWQQLDDRVIAEVSRWTPKLHVWGALGYYFKSDLYFFEENMNAKLYQSIVSVRLPPNHFAPDCPEQLKKNWYFLQDNDPKHKAKGSMKLLKELTGCRMYKHPANSPDFNVMEDVWSYLDRHVRASKLTTIGGLKRKLTKLWNELSWTEFRPSVDSMPTRLRQCLTRRGGRTDY
jgi:transposase